MELSEIRKIASQDMPIDDTELDTESLKIPQIHNKYLNLYHDERLVLRKLETDYKSQLKINILTLISKYNIYIQNIKIIVTSKILVYI